jgi:hypothetical protein
MTTPEQIQAWARESGFITGTVGPQNLPFVTQVAGSFTVELQRFADLARADLVEDVKVLEKELGNTVSMARADDLIAERDALHTEVEQVRADRDGLHKEWESAFGARSFGEVRAEVEALRKDAERYRSALEQIANEELYGNGLAQYRMQKAACAAMKDAPE